MTINKAVFGHKLSNKAYCSVKAGSAEAAAKVVPLDHDN